MYSFSVCLLVQSKSIVCALSSTAVYCDYYNEEGQCSWHYEACPQQIRTCGKNNKYSGKLEGPPPITSFQFITSLCPGCTFWTVIYSFINWVSVNFWSVWKMFTLNIYYEFILYLLYIIYSL